MNAKLQGPAARDRFMESTDGRERMTRTLASLVLPTAFALFAPTADAGAEVYRFSVDPGHSQVGFKVRHLVAKVAGQFDDFSGSVRLDPENVGTLTVEGTVRTASITTNNEKRDIDLRGPDFFDVESFPEMTLATKGVEVDGEDITLLADVTLRGVTKEVEFDVEFGGVMTSPFTGTPTTGIGLDGTLNRKDFGMVWNKTLDAGGVVLGEDVHIQVQLEATVPPEAGEEG